MRILITSGGTTVPIDAVRKITNMSKGTFGSQICESFINDYEFSDRELDITFLSHITGRLPSCLSDLSASCIHLKIGEQQIIRPFYNLPVRFIGFDTFDQYREILFQLLDTNQYDCIILAAAVSDYGVDPSSFYNGKVRSTEDQMCIKLIKLPKLISQVKDKQPNTTLVGFKLLVNSSKEYLQEQCIKSIHDNNVDLIVGNDLKDIKQDNHTLMIGTKYFDYNFNTPDKICFETYSKQEAIENKKTLSEYLVDVIYEVFYVKNKLKFYPKFQPDVLDDCRFLEKKNCFNWCTDLKDFCCETNCPIYKKCVDDYKKQFIKG